MIKIKVLSNYKNYQANTVYIVNENEAHTLIDKGIAALYHTQVTSYSNKMMRSKNK